MKVGRVSCPFHIHHLLRFLLSYTLHALSAASHCLFLHTFFFFCNLLCPWCQSLVLKSWLNILPPTFKLWSLSSYMDICFTQVGSSIYFKQSLYWQNHIFRSFHFKKINSGALDKKAAQLLGGIGPDVWVWRKGSGIIVDKMTMVHRCGTTVKKGNVIVWYMSRIIKCTNHKVLSINQSLQIWA